MKQNSVAPPAASASIVQSRIRLPRISAKHFGAFSVVGMSLRPRPAPMMIARIRIYLDSVRALRPTSFGGGAMLKVERLTKRFGALVAVDNVSFEVPAGQMVGIIGRSGAGKSTLLRMINRLTDATSGTIDCDGVGVLALRGRRVREWRAQCAMVFQQ